VISQETVMTLDMSVTRRGELMERNCLNSLLIWVRIVDSFDRILSHMAPAELFDWIDG